MNPLLTFTRPPSWPDLTDTQRTYWLLKKAGDAGAHSWDLAEAVPTRNASQRCKDTVSKGFPVYAVDERRGSRAGTRYFLDGFQPSEATPVQPNFGSAAASDEVSKDAQPNTSREEEEPRSSAGRPARLTLVASYLGDEPEWFERWERAA